MKLSCTCKDISVKKNKLLNTFKFVRFDVFMAVTILMMFMAPSISEERLHVCMWWQVGKSERKGQSGGVR
jgi:hypothetical protein